MTLALAAFAPPEIKREPAQQQTSKGWIPKLREKPPPANFYAWDWSEQTRAGKTVRPGLPEGDYLSDEDLPPECKDVPAVSGSPPIQGDNRSPSQFVLPADLLKARCAKRPPEDPNPVRVKCKVVSSSGWIEVIRREIAKPLSDANWFESKKLYVEAHKAIIRAGAAAERVEERFAVASARLRLARARIDQSGEVEALQEQLETGCLDDLSADVARSTIDYLEKLSSEPH